MNRIKCWVLTVFPHRIEGQGLVEYGLILALVSIAAIAGLVLFRPAISTLLSDLAASV